MAKRIPVAEGIVVAAVLLVGVLVVAGPRSGMSSGALALAVAAGCGLAAWAWSLVASKKKRTSEFGAREPLTPEEIFSAFYSGSGLPRDVVVRLWKECASQLGCPAERLRPSDRFDRELAAADFFSALDDPREDLARYATAFAGKRGVSIDLKATKTLDDLIRQLAAIEGGTQQVK